MVPPSDNNKDISQPSSIVASYALDWQRNRDVLAGARMIRLNSIRYLPMMPGQDLLGYRSFINRVRFFPAASRTHDGLVGLMFRKAVTITAPDAALPLLDTITDRGWKLEKLTRWVASELLAVAWGGLLVDLPVAPQGLDKATERQGNYRPFVAPYVAESVLSVTPGVVNNRTVLMRVVLKDDDKTIRELLLIDGVYTVVMHRQGTSGSWLVDAPVQPRFAGNLLSEIPFTLISLDDFNPVTAPMSDVCDHNIRHYIACSNLSACHYFSSSPIYNVMGTKTKAEDFHVYPGALWAFEDPTVETKVLEYEGKSIAALRQEVEDIRDEMAAIGMRILASDKAAVESADALAIRAASENATLATLSRIANEMVNRALDHFAMALGQSPDLFRVTINTDYNAIPLNNLQVQAYVAAWQAGAFSRSTLQGIFIDGEVLPEYFDAELDAQQRAEEVSDRPAVTDFSTPDAPISNPKPDTPPTSK